MTRRTSSERKPRFTKDERETSCRRYLKVWRNGHEALDRGVTGGQSNRGRSNKRQSTPPPSLRNACGPSVDNYLLCCSEWSTGCWCYGDRHQYGTTSTWCWCYGDHHQYGTTTTSTWCWCYGDHHQYGTTTTSTWLTQNTSASRDNGRSASCRPHTAGHNGRTMQPHSAGQAADPAMFQRAGPHIRGLTAHSSSQRPEAP
ncbi:unnamed protein product [Gadus morhua 'NCC']